MESLLISIVDKTIRAGAGAVKRDRAAPAKAPSPRPGRIRAAPTRGRAQRSPPPKRGRFRRAPIRLLEVIYAAPHVCGTRTNETRGRGRGVDHRPQPRRSGALRGPRRVAGGGAGVGPAPAGHDALPRRRPRRDGRGPVRPRAQPGGAPRSPRDGPAPARWG